MAYSTVSLEEMLAGESEEFRRSVKQRTAELIAEELHLRVKSSKIRTYAPRRVSFCLAETPFERVK
jgi:hypothetical protein